MSEQQTSTSSTVPATATTGNGDPARDPSTASDGVQQPSSSLSSSGSNKFTNRLKRTFTRSKRPSRHSSTSSGSTNTNTNGSSMKRGSFHSSDGSAPTGTVPSAGPVYNSDQSGDFTGAFDEETLLKTRVGTLNLSKEDEPAWSREAQLPDHPSAKGVFYSLASTREELAERRKQLTRLRHKEQKLLAKVAATQLYNDVKKREEDTRADDSVSTSVPAPSDAEEAQPDAKRTGPRTATCYASAMTRTVRLERPQTGVPLGVELDILLVPQRAIDGRIVPEVRHAPFVVSVESGGVAEASGLKVGDEVLSIDGISTEEKKLRHIVEQLDHNQGTVLMSVAHSFDYHRMEHYKKIVETRTTLDRLRSQKVKLKERERDLLARCEQHKSRQAMMNEVASWENAPDVDSGDEDALSASATTWLHEHVPAGVHPAEADIISQCTTIDHFKEAILAMQEAWNEERRMFDGSRAILQMRLDKLQGTMRSIKQASVISPSTTTAPQLQPPPQSQSQPQPPMTFEIDLTVDPQFDEPPPVPPSDDDDDEEDDGDAHADAPGRNDAVTAGVQTRLGDGTATGSESASLDQPSLEQQQQVITFLDATTTDV